MQKYKATGLLEINNQLLTKTVVVIASNKMQANQKAKNKLKTDMLLSLEVI